LFYQHPKIRRARIKQFSILVVNILNEKILNILEVVQKQMNQGLVSFVKKNCEKKLKIFIEKILLF